MIDLASYPRRETSQTAKHILEQVLVAAVALDVDLPERRYYTFGGAVFDEEQVVVSVSSIESGMLGQIQEANVINHGCLPTWKCRFEVAVCLPAMANNQDRLGNLIPIPQQMENDADRISDLWDVYRLVIDRMVLDPRYNTIIASVAAGTTEGGLISLVLTLQLNLFQNWVESPQSYTAV